MTNRKIINEGVSPVVFHFCPLSVMYQISLNDTFNLSETGKYDSDKRMNSFYTGKKAQDGQVIRKTYPYYMCFSRTPSSMVGYQRMRIEKTGGEWTNSLVRIELDGNALNARFKGAPVNFFTEKNQSKNSDLAKKYEMGRDWSNFRAIPSRNGTRTDKMAFSNGNLVKREIPKINPDAHKRGRTSFSDFGKPKVDYQELERNRMSEYEDRIFSYEKTIPNASRYIKRIDIKITKSSLSQRAVTAMISKIIETYGKNKVFVYDNDIAFNSMNVRGQISLPKYFSSIANDFHSNDTVEYEIKKTDLSAISFLISMIAFTPDFTEEKYNNNILSLCKITGLSNWKFYDSNINYSSEIIKRCFNNLLMFNNENTGYLSTFPTFTLNVRNFEKRNQGKKELMDLIEKILYIGKKDALNVSKKILNGEEISIQVATRIKYELYLNNKR